MLGLNVLNSNHENTAVIAWDLFVFSMCPVLKWRYTKKWNRTHFAAAKKTQTLSMPSSN